MNRNARLITATAVTAVTAVTALLTALLAAGIGTASAEETGPNAWCFRPSVAWFPVAAEAYVPRIECEERELPTGGPAEWSSDAMPELAVAPDDWSLPTRSLRLTRWRWAHEYDAATGETYIYGEMRRKQGQSPTGGTQPVVYLSVACSESGTLHLGILSDVAPLDGSHSVVWWTNRNEYRRAEIWEAEQLPDGSAFYRAWAPFPDHLWAVIRDSSWLYVIVFGDRSWQMAEAYVTQINQLDVVEQLDYCGQDQRFNGEPEAR